MFWAWVKPWQLCIGVAPKCGTRTLYQGLLDNFPNDGARLDKSLEMLFNSAIIDVLRPGEVAQLALPKIWIVRHPWERFKSLWRDKCRDQGAVEMSHRWGRKMAKMDPRQLYNFIKMACNDNEHWTPQCRLMGLIGRPMVEPGVTLVRTESLSEWWPWGTLKHENRTEDEDGYNWTDKTLQEHVERLYKADLQLWEHGY